MWQDCGQTMQGVLSLPVDLAQVRGWVAWLCSCPPGCVDIPWSPCIQTNGGFLNYKNVDTPNHPKLEHFSILKSMLNICWCFWGSRILRNLQMRIKQWAEKELEDFEGLSRCFFLCMPNASKCHQLTGHVLKCWTTSFKQSVWKTCAHTVIDSCSCRCTSPSPPCVNTCWAIQCDRVGY